MRRKLLAGLAGVAAVVALAGPAAAEDTIVTLTVDAAGGLSITVPATANIGHGVEGSTVSGQLGPVTVLDQRGSLTPNWTATVISTDFVTGGGSSGETIPNINVLYWSGSATATAGGGTFTPGQQTAAQQQIINVPRTAFSHTGGTGNNFATWNPTLVVNIPDGTVGGTYTGTVTHSVF
ncbi:hypothetical protein EAD89_00260 [Micromonospora sp. BL4]|uniref:hypothetical protein n=1 Tax=Micromonospora sp. BL4 TaxID=2478710 RepID=UPI000EF5DE74|nr:hypothetical protein [Micromonospora sp. BL4]RLP96094.1 hypothetical protein EAD89_00260 [Micromonospora sp. BL4]